MNPETKVIMRQQSSLLVGVGSLVLFWVLFADTSLQAGQIESTIVTTPSRDKQSDHWREMVIIMKRRNFEYTAEFGTLNDVPENDVPENDVPENDVPENEKLEKIVTVFTKMVEQFSATDAPIPTKPIKSAFPEWPHFQFIVPTSSSESTQTVTKPVPGPPNAPSNLSVSRSDTSSL